MEFVLQKFFAPNPISIFRPRISAIFCIFGFTKFFLMVETIKIDKVCPTVFFVVWGSHPRWWWRGTKWSNFAPKWTKTLHLQFFSMIRSMDIYIENSYILKLDIFFPVVFLLMVSELAQMTPQILLFFAFWWCRSNKGYFWRHRLQNICPNHFYTVFLWLWGYEICQYSVYYCCTINFFLFGFDKQNICRILLPHNHNCGMWCEIVR